MTHIEQPQSGSSKPILPDLTFEEVRQSFLERLHGEQARLVVLAEMLGSGAPDEMSVLRELELLAHRMRGAAGVFAAIELSEDAKSLELAATAAADMGGCKDDRLVLATLRTLIARLALMNGIRPSP